MRVTLTRGPGGRGYSPKDAGQPTLAMTLHPLPPQDADEPVQWSLVTSSFRIPASRPAGFVQDDEQDFERLARIEAEEKGADEALLSTPTARWPRPPAEIYFWVYQDKICTVPTGRGVLPGITRAVVLEICQSLGLETNKCVIKPEQLRRAEGLFVTNSALGIVPVAAFDGGPVAPSPLVDQIAGAYQRNAGARISLSIGLDLFKSSSCPLRFTRMRA